MKKPMPLRRYLLLQLLLVASLPMALVALLMWLYLPPKMYSDIGLHHQSLARAVAGQISAHLMGGERQLLALAAYFQSSDRRPPALWQSLLDAQCSEGDLFETIYIVNEDQRIQSVGLTEPRRNQREDLLGLDLSGRQVFPHIDPGAKAAWSETFLSTVSSRLAVAVAVPLNGPTLIGEIAVDQLSEFISHLPLESALLTIILDRQDRIIAASQREYSGLHFQTQDAGMENKAGRGQIASHRFELDERPFFGTDVTIARLGWKVLVAQPLDEIYQPVRSTLAMITIGVVLALALAFALGFLQASGLTQIYRKYADLARMIARGKYALDWPQPRTQEFAHLAASLKDMARMISQREGALEESENNLRITLDSIGDAVIAADGQGKISRMNPTAENLTGWSFNEAAGRPLPEVFRIVNAFTRETAFNPVEKVLSTGQVVALNEHTVLIAREGREYQIADSGAPIRTPDGEIVGVVLVFRDVTEAYARDQEIKANAAKLRNITANVPGVVSSSMPRHPTNIRSAS